MHLSENDIEYQPGWSDRVVDYFDCFPTLGQLSLFGPVPTDDEVWGIKPAMLRHAQGRILYEALKNVGTTSVIRRELHDDGLRIHTLEQEGGHQLPADMLLSQDVRAAGYFVAWADHYLVRNVGHTEDELRSRLEYYEESNRSKPWAAGTDISMQLQARERKPQPRRSSLLFPDEKVSPEKSPARARCPQPQLWSMFDGWTAEVETVEFLYGLIRLIKPHFAVETGTWHGYSAASIGRAMQENGIGSLVTLEADPESCNVATERVRTAGLDAIVDVINASSLSWTPDRPIDFLLADSDIAIRIEEFHRFEPFLSPLAIVVFHDTSEIHAVVRKGLNDLEAAGVLACLHLPTPRGIAICQYPGAGTHPDAKAAKPEHVSATDGKQSVPPPVERPAKIDRLPAGRKDQTVIPVLAMHRSGSSMLTRVLNLLGMQLGEPLLEPTPDNPLGYWENEFFIQTNSEVLHTMQVDSDGFARGDVLLQIPAACSRILVEDQKRDTISAFLESTFHDPIWGWKDPRTVLTWNLWDRLLPQFGFSDIRPIIIARHPQTTAASLVRRVRSGTKTQESDEQLTFMATDVWSAYNRILLNLAEQHDWFVTTYELLSDPRHQRNELDRLCRYTGLQPDHIDIAIDAIRNDSRPAPEHGTSPAASLYSRLAMRANDASRTVLPADVDEKKLLIRADQVRQQGSIKAAVDLLTKALEIRPHYHAARFRLGYTLMETGHITHSAEHAEQLIRSRPHDPVGHGLLAFGLTQQARISEAIEAFDRCIEKLPSNSVDRSNMLFSSLYSDTLEPADVTRLHREAGQEISRYAETDNSFPNETPRSPDPDQRIEVTGRQLRIGYLSGDLKRHPVGYFLRSLLTHHSEHVEIFCYDIGSEHDDLTDILRDAAGHWRAARDNTDSELLNRIRSDQIDVLIDLCGHSSGNRAPLLTQRAAPVQALYLGYPCTSGLPNVDFVISDSRVSPLEYDDLYSERVLRLQRPFLCFHPHDDAPDIAPLPFDENGFVTFGSFNNLPKISPMTVRLWAKVLQSVPASRLVMKTLSFQDPGTRELFRSQFADEGIDSSRIDLLPPTVPLTKFLDEYRRIDVGLDSVPYNGGTTTCESLWMGVPVITMPGRHFFSRMGLSLLQSVDLPELVASSEKDFVRIATNLANNTDRLRVWRKGMRDRLARSPLCDASGFTAEFEELLVRAVTAAP